MRIFNKDKTQQLTNVDLTAGRLVGDKLFVRHHEAVPFRGHAESFINEFGIPETRLVCDQKAKAAYDEYENIQVFIPYTDEEKAQMAQSEKQNRIDELKSLLASTDYKAIKYAEGELMAEEYAETKLQRRAWRLEINSLGG